MTPFDEMGSRRTGPALYEEVNSMSISVREVEAIKATLACCPSRCS